LKTIEEHHRNLKYSRKSVRFSSEAYKRRELISLDIKPFSKKLKQFNSTDHLQKHKPIPFEDTPRFLNKKYESMTYLAK
jgi:hypothetical protein